MSREMVLPGTTNWEQLVYSYASSVGWLGRPFQS